MIPKSKCVTSQIYFSKQLTYSDWKIYVS